MRKSFIISAVAHVVVLILCLITLVFSPSASAPPPPLAVSTISNSEFTKMTQGVEHAPPPKAEPPKPLADKIDAAKPVKEFVPKVSDKPEIKTEAAARPAASEAKPAAKPPEKTEKPKEAKAKPDQLADELKKEEVKKPPKPEKKQPEFKPDQIAEELKKEEFEKSEAVREVRRRPGRGAARQARSATPGRKRGSAQQPGVARRADRAGGAAVAVRT